MSKKQWKNVTDNVSLQFSTKSWASEEPDAPTMDVSEIRSVLPTKTSATRAISDLESIGANGPFVLAFANIPYEASETDLMNFFRLHDIIRVQKSEGNKGQGILEFRDRVGLAGALNMNEKVFINRPIRLKIATKDEMARLSMSGGRNRPQNQQSRNTQQSGLNLEDSDNWRAKKSTPTHSSGTGSGSENVVGNERNRDTQKTWRQDRQPVVAASSGVSIDQSDNWRRGTRTGDTAAASQSSAGNRNDRAGGNFNRPAANHFSEQTPPQKELVTRDSGDKKVSIFGEAKPVDTFSKDREIEKKMEETKKQVTDQPDTNVSKSGARSVKKPTTNASAPATSSNTSQSTPENKSSPTSSSTGLEWRTNRAPATSSNRSRQVSDTSSVKSSDQSSAPAPQPEQQQQIKVDAKLAPIPPNFWAERMKSKNTTPAPVASKDTVTILDRNSNTAKPQQQSLDTTIAAATTTTATVTTTAVTSPSEKTVASKPPVVISANGPYIDPRARSHHHSSGSSPAAAAPVSMTISSLDNNNNTASVVSAAVGSSINRAPVAAVSSGSNSATASASASDSSKQGATPPARSGDLKGPWSKGPPRGLIDKA